MSKQDILDGSTVSYLKSHPRLLGVLFALMVLCAQAAPVVANGSSSSGP